MMHGEQVYTSPLKVYSRRKVLDPEPKHAELPAPSPNSHPSPNSKPQPVCCLDSNTSEPNSSTHQESEPNFDDLDIPIVRRKGTQTCTRHPLHLFLTYSHLSPTYKAFLTKLYSIPIPKTLFEALSNKNWKDAMKVEMTALEKNQT